MSNVTYQNDESGSPQPQTQTGAEGAADVNIASGAVAIDPSGNIIRNQLFPINALTARYSVTATVMAAAQLPINGSSVRLVNEGPNTCYVAVGGSGVAAGVPTSTPSANATPLLAGEDVTFWRNTASGTYISAICATNQTAVLNVSTGEGM